MNVQGQPLKSFSQLLSTLGAHDPTGFLKTSVSFVLLKTRTAIYRSVRALRAQNPPKVSKKSPRASGPGVSKKSRRESKSLKNVSKRDFSETFLRLFDSFRDFLDTLDPDAWGDFFEAFWGWPEDFCKWPFGSQISEIVDIAALARGVGWRAQSLLTEIWVPAKVCLRTCLPKCLAKFG